MSVRFQQSVSLEERKREVAKVQQQYPGKLPLFLEKSNSSHLPDPAKNKFLVPRDILFSQFLLSLRKKLELPPTNGLHVLVNGTPCPQE